MSDLTSLVEYGHLQFIFFTLVHIEADFDPRCLLLLQCLELFIEEPQISLDLVLDVYVERWQRPLTILYWWSSFLIVLCGARRVLGRAVCDSITDVSLVFRGLNLVNRVITSVGQAEVPVLLIILVYLLLLGLWPELHVKWLEALSQKLLFGLHLAPVLGPGSLGSELREQVSDSPLATIKSLFVLNHFYN